MCAGRKGKKGKTEGGRRRKNRENKVLVRIEENVHLGDVPSARVYVMMDLAK